MKSILYVGATLMIGASIYGFVDYKKTNPSAVYTEDLKSLPSPAPDALEDIRHVEPVDKIQEEKLLSKKQSTVKKETPAKKPAATKKLKKSKKKNFINSKAFSRSSLRHEELSIIEETAVTKEN